MNLEKKKNVNTVQIEKGNKRKVKVQIEYEKCDLTKKSFLRPQCKIGGKNPRK